MSTTKQRNNETNWSASVFTGRATEYIGVRFLYYVLIIFTLGLGTPWAVCMYQRWRIKSTIVHGHRLTFDGKGWHLFWHCWLWGFLSIVTLGIYALWLPVKVEEWFAKHTHLKCNEEVKHIRFPSQFYGSFAERIGINICSFFLFIITLGIATPWIACMYLRWRIDNCAIDGKQLMFDGTGRQLFGRAFLWFLLTIITVGIFAFFIPFKMEKWVTKHTNFM